jgi:thioredoxin 1
MIYPAGSNDGRGNQIEELCIIMNFRKAIQDHPNTIVLFYTDWSASSFMMSEMLSQLQDEYAGELEVLFVNADESQQIGARYGIRRIPTLAFFREEDIVKTVEGTASRSDITGLIHTLFMSKKRGGP